MTDKISVKEYIENCIQEIYDKKNIKTSEVIYASWTTNVQEEL